MILKQFKPLQWVQQLMNVVKAFTAKAASTAKKVTHQCKQSLHKYFAGQDYRDKEKEWKCCKKESELAKAGFEHLLQEVIRETSRCLDNVNRQQALRSHSTLFDILTEYLKNLYAINAKKNYGYHIPPVILWILFSSLLNEAFFRVFPSLAIIPTPVGATITAIGVFITIGKVVYPMYLAQSAVCQMQQLEEDLQCIQSQNIGILHLLGKLGRLIWELRRNNSNEKRLALEDSIKYIINEISLFAASCEEKD
ncbi:hypothetical protein PS15p_211760 [Mucor circinelloides]